MEAAVTPIMHQVLESKFPTPTPTDLTQSHNVLKDDVCTKRNVFDTFEQLLCHDEQFNITEDRNPACRALKIKSEPVEVSNTVAKASKGVQAHHNTLVMDVKSEVIECKFNLKPSFMLLEKLNIPEETKEIYGSSKNSESVIAFSKCNNNRETKGYKSDSTYQQTCNNAPCVDIGRSPKSPISMNATPTEISETVAMSSKGVQVDPFDYEMVIKSEKNDYNHHLKPCSVVIKRMDHPQNVQMNSDKNPECLVASVECTIKEHTEGYVSETTDLHVCNVTSRDNIVGSCPTSPSSNNSGPMELSLTETDSANGIEVHPPNYKMFHKSDKNCFDYNLKPCSVVLRQSIQPKKSKIADINSECKEVHFEGTGSEHTEIYMNDSSDQQICNNVQLQQVKKQSATVFKKRKAVTTGQKRSKVHLHVHDRETSSQSKESDYESNLKSSSLVVQRLKRTQSSGVLGDSDMQYRQPVVSFKHARMKSSCQSSIFKCSVCDRRFHQKRRYDIHLATHKKKHKCHQCIRKFTTESFLKKHLSRYHNISTKLSCKQCDQQFPNEKSLSTHMDIHKNGYDCPDCGRPFLNLTTHIMFAHGVHKLLLCEKCGKLFPNKKLLSDHLANHEKRCNYGDCRKVFRSESSLVKHIKKSHINQQHFSSDKCRKTFGTEKSLSAHSARHKKKFGCPQCSVSFSHKKSLNTHIRIVHNSNTFYSCEHCGKKFSGERNYLAHKEAHKSGYKCTYCDKIYTRKSHLEDHELINHTNDMELFSCKKCGKKLTDPRLISAHVSLHKKGHNCDECGKGYENIYGLKAHKQRAHDNSKLFSCDQCGKKFADEELLSAHLDIHKKGFNCNECGQVYEHACSLRIHMIRVHNKKVEPFSCEQCGKSFHQEKSFSAHLEVHEKGYNCKECGKGYSAHSKLKSHIEKSHPTYKHLSCKQCGKIFYKDSKLSVHMESHKKGKSSDHCGKKKKKPYMRTFLIDTRLPCKQCNKKFNNERLLSAHMAIHKNGYNCKECGRVYTTRQTLIQHKSRCHSVSCEHCGLKFHDSGLFAVHLDIHKTGYNCKECGRAFASEVGLNVHMVNYHGKRELKLTCKQCDKIFSDEISLTAHLEIHKKGYNCKECGRGYGSMEILKKHIARDHSSHLSCNQCDRKFYQARFLSAHLAYHNKGNDCKHCGRAYSSEDSLIAHMIRAHDEAEVQFTCKQCDRRFLHESSYTAHLEIHNKGYNCKECGRGYVNKSSLGNHMDHAHGNSETCEQCGMTFYNPKSFSDHLDIHKKGYNCEECGKAFKYENRIKTHMEKAHGKGKVQFSCKQCDKIFRCQKILSAHLEVHKKGFNCKECGRGYVNRMILRMHISKVHGKSALPPLK